MKEVWDHDEELRTITCFNNDPICDHCFDLCQSILKKTNFFRDIAIRAGNPQRRTIYSNVSQNLRNLWTVGENT
jgi:hypothetical protein